MGGNENRYHGRNNKGKRSKSYTEGVAMRNDNVRRNDDNTRHVSGRDDGHRREDTRSATSRNGGNWRADARTGDFRNNDGRNHDGRRGNNDPMQNRRHEEFVPIPHMPAPACGVCGQPVIDLTSALSSGADLAVPAHFECVLKKIEEQEHPGHNERVIYIGQGKFAVAYYENPSDQKRFKILRIVQWEESQAERSEWRETLSGYYSQIK